MDSRKFDLEADIQEIEKILKLCTRKHTKDLLSASLVSLSQELSRIPDTSPEPAPVVSEVQWKSIDRFAWEQTDDEVKIYVTCLDGLKSHPRDKVHLESTSKSVSISIVNFNNNNYKLKFPSLFKDIKDARFTLKSNGFSLSLKKKEKSNWESIAPKPSGLKKGGEEDSACCDEK